MGQLDEGEDEDGTELKSEKGQPQRHRGTEETEDGKTELTAENAENAERKRMRQRQRKILNECRES